LGVFVVGWVDMDGEDLKILSSPIERDSSINEDLDKVGQYKTRQVLLIHQLVLVC
jgi:hypothetical protein